MQYLVTGSTGFIGSHIVNELIHQGDSVIALYYRNRKHCNDNVNYVSGDITKFKSLSKICDEYSIDGIFHCAAVMDVRKSIVCPNIVHDGNITGTLNVLQAARDAGIDRILFTSSSSVYGNASASPIKENIVLNPTSFYGLSKQIGEQYVNYFSKCYGMSAIILRYFNVYGSGQHSKTSPMTIIPLFIQKILSGESLKVFGDGNQTRDFLYIKDVVDVTISAMKSRVTGTYNIGSGTETSVNQIIEIIQDIIGTDVSVEHLPEKNEEIKHSFADISAAKNAFSFNPKTKIRDGIWHTYMDLLSLKNDRYD